MDKELRDYFAAAALTGLCSDRVQQEIWARAGDHEPDEYIASKAYEFADEMMKARKVKR